MSIIPAHELPFLEPFVAEGVRVLEFGDKRNPSGLYRDWYVEQGCVYTSVDINNRNGAIGLDVRQPFDLGEFDVVTNWGFSEHVSVQKPFWENAYNSMGEGGVFVGTTPKPDHWLNHAWSFWHPKEEFFLAWAEANGMEILMLDDCGPGDPAKRMWGYAIQRWDDAPHVWLPEFDGLFWRNPNWRIPKDGHVDYGAA